MAKRMTTAGMAPAMTTSACRGTLESAADAVVIVCNELEKAEAEGRADLVSALTQARDTILARMLAEAGGL